MDSPLYVKDFFNFAPLEYNAHLSQTDNMFNNTRLTAPFIQPPSVLAGGHLEYNSKNIIE